MPVTSTRLMSGKCRRGPKHRIIVLFEGSPFLLLTTWLILTNLRRKDNHWGLRSQLQCLHMHRIHKRIMDNILIGKQAETAGRTFRRDRVTLKQEQW